MSRIIIGTAGHIDHGKTALVKALTGIDTDRLKEEQERGITIELGFAPLVLPGGSQVAIIDVPGHERFVRNMLAGAAGMDMAFLVVAANEGVMPQTREHLAILRFLAIREIIVVITKIDLLEEEFLPLLHEEVRDLLKETRYCNAKIAEVSVYTGQGLNYLLRLVEDTVLALPERRVKEELVRLPLDRTFKIQGFGTVGTGTLFDGIIRVGDLLEVPDKKAQIKVRNIQVHGESVQQALAGQRVALNLVGIEVGKLRRGDVLTTPGWLSASNRIDLSIQLLIDSPQELVDMVRVRFHQGAKETLGRVFVLGKERILPGEEGFIQVVLEETVVVLKGDSYVLRSYSPLHTIGGGLIIDPVATKHRKGQPNLGEELMAKASTEPAQQLAYLLEQSKDILSMKELGRSLGLGFKDVRESLVDLINKGKVIEIKAGEEEPLYIGSGRLQGWQDIIAREIKIQLQQFPLSPGLNKEVARSKMFANISVRNFNILLQLMVEARVIRIVDKQYLLPYDIERRVSELQAESLAAITALYKEAGWQIPDWKSVKERLGIKEKDSKQLLAYLIHEGVLLTLNEDLYLLPEQLQLGRGLLQTWFCNNTDLTVAQFRDLLVTTRRIAIPLLEYFDRVKFTNKAGDLRSSGPALFDSLSVSRV